MAPPHPLQLADRADSALMIAIHHYHVAGQD
jgi:hypothetical protein